MKIQRFVYLSCLLCLPLPSFAFFAGSGTPEDPYLIHTCQELQNVLYYPTEHFQLADNINCQSFEYGDGGGFMPIGKIYPFMGTLDGNHFTISHLFVNRADENYIGLIAQMDYGARVMNLNISDATIIGSYYTGVIGMAGSQMGAITNVNIMNTTIKGNNYIGGAIGAVNGSLVYDDTLSLPVENIIEHINVIDSEIIADNYAGGVIGSATGNAYILSDLYFKGTISGASNIGGVVGSAYHTSIFNSQAYVEVNATGALVGGLVGSMHHMTIANSMSSGSVSSPQSRHVGGLVGYAFGTSAYPAYLQNNFAQSIVYGMENVGGLVGYISVGDLLNNYAIGEAHGDYFAGGLLGMAVNSVITHNYAATRVTGAPDTIGGLIAGGTSTVYNSYWDMDVSDQLDSVGGTGKTTAEMYHQATYMGWDFNQIWKIEEGLDYPQLQIVATK